MSALSLTESTGTLKIICPSLLGVKVAVYVVEGPVVKFEKLPTLVPLLVLAVNKELPTKDTLSLKVTDKT